MKHKSFIRKINLQLFGETEKNKILAKIKDLMSKQQTIVDKAKAEENRALTEDEVKDFNSHQKEIDSLKKQVEILDKMDANDKFMNAPVNNPVMPVVNDVQGEVLDDGGFKNLGELVHALRFGDTTGRVTELAENKTGEGGGRAVPDAFKAAFMPSVRNEWTMGVGSEGGFAVPAQYGKEILQIQPEQAIVRTRANVVPAGDPPDAPITFPAFSQGSNGVFGGVEIFWIGEGQTKPETDAKLEEVMLQPHEVAAHTVVTDKLLRNWEAANAFISTLLRGATNAAEDLAFIRGDGVAKPFGALNCPGTISVNRGTANQISYIDVVNMQARLFPESVSNALWIANQSAFPQITTLQDPAGHYIFIQGDATRGIPATLNGIPIKFTGKTSTIGNKGDLALVDLKYYLIKDGSGPFIAASEHALFRQNKTIIKVFWNVDGQGWVKNPLTLEDGSTTVSFAVVLDIPAV